MSVANLLNPGRQSAANIGVNSLRYAQLTTAERLAFTPSEGLTVFDSTLNELFLYANGNWAQLASSGPTGTIAAMVGPTAPRSITNDGNDLLLDNNMSVIYNEGFTVDSVAGTLALTQTGVYAISAMVHVNTSVAPTSGTFTFSVTNGAGTNVLSAVRAGATTVTSQSFTCSGIVRNNSGDTFGLALTVNTSAPPGIISDAVAIGVAPYETFLSIALIG